MTGNNRDHIGRYVDTSDGGLLSLRMYNPPIVRNRWKLVRPNTIGVILPEAEYGYFQWYNEVLISNVFGRQTKRTAQTLISLIERHVAPGSRIYFQTIGLPIYTSMN